MQVTTLKKYNEQQTQKWQRDSKAYWEKNSGAGQEALYTAPQLAFYLFSTSRNYGYVAYDDNTALWDKSKKGVIEYWENEQRKRKIRGY